MVCVLVQDVDTQVGHRPIQEKSKSVPFYFHSIPSVFVGKINHYVPALNRYYENEPFDCHTFVRSVFLIFADLGDGLTMPTPEELQRILVSTIMQYSRVKAICVK